MVENILTIYELSDDIDKIDGMSWYQRAQRYAAGLARDYQLSLSTVAGMISALSPATSWSRNQSNVETLLEDNTATFSGYPSSRLKALDILKGANPAKVLPQDKKTGYFWRNIVNPTHETDVTLDSWAVKIAVDMPDLSLSSYSKFVNTAPKYNVMANAYRIAADKIGILPLELQAVVWVAYRRLFATGIHNQDLAHRQNG